jgi:hypothetical protein
VLPLVCVALVALLGAASLALDLSRMYAVAVELQTAADAGALAGARGLQDDPGNAAGTVAADAVALATSNPVFGRRPTAGEVAVDPMTRDDANGVAPAAWASANAVRVTVERRTPFVFGDFMGLTPPTIRRRATAWVANVTRATCVRPLGLPFQYVWEMAGRPGKPAPGDKLTADDVKRVTESTQGNQGGGSGGGQAPQTAPAASAAPATTAENTTPTKGKKAKSTPSAHAGADGTVELTAAWNPSDRDFGDPTKWSPVSVQDNNSTSGYEEQFAESAARCAGQSVAMDGTEDGRALNGGSVERATHAGLAGLCGTTAAQCNGPDGLTLRVSWVSTNGAGNKGGSSGSSANDAQFRLVSYVRVVCYFGAAFDGKASAPSNCPSTNYQGRPPGTMLIEVLPPTAGSPMPGDEYGNAASGIQRLMLVR